MRLTILALGVTLLDITLTDGSDETEFETYQDAGTIGSERIAVDGTPWDGPDVVHHFDPGEGDEDRRIGFQAKSPEQLKREFLRAQPPFPS